MKPNKVDLVIVGWLFLMLVLFFTAKVEIVVVEQSKEDKCVCECNFILEEKQEPFNFTFNPAGIDRYKFYIFNLTPSSPFWTNLSNLSIWKSVDGINDKCTSCWNTGLI